MGGEGSGRKPDPVKALLNPKLQPIAKGTGTGVAGNFILPNYGAAKGAAATSALDATYLRLDTSNDPLLNDLDMNSNNLLMDEGYISFDESASTMRIQAANSETLKFTSQKIMQFEAQQFECNPTSTQDIDWYFIGSSKTGIITWKNFDDYFFFSDDIRLQNAEFLEFGTYGNSTITFNGEDLIIDNDKLGSGAAITVVGFSGAAGVVMNDAFGVITGGNEIDISADTNLQVFSPIVLTGDILSLDKTVPYTWTGVHKFNGNAAFETSDSLFFGTGALVEMEHDGTNLILDLENSGTSDLHIRGDVHISGSRTVTGEVQGSKVLFQCGRYTTMNAVGTNYFMRMPDFVMMSLTKGFVPSRPGSITGVGIIYDIVSQTGSPTLDLRVYVNGSIVWTNSLNNAVANDKKNNFTQARGTDTFLAGDVISVSIIASGKSATINMNDVAVNIEMIYDE
jgi:hypothetical protein